MEKILYNINTLSVEKNQFNSMFEYYSIKLKYETEIGTLLNDGWEEINRNKQNLKLQRIKKPQDLFRDKVWTLMLKTGFQLLNKSKKVEINKDSNSFYFDVVASDNDTILAIICFTEFNKDSIIEIKDKILRNTPFLLNYLRTDINAESKVKFIFAFSDNILKEEMNSLIRNSDIYLLGDIEIQYYDELSTHLGSASKYQLLGNLFENQRISSIDSIIPAIEGNMGGHVYYSFSIEPAKLLKFSYVLHRNDVHKNSMPSYQRLIKKNRLKQISSFVEKGGFFPNSIIVNINTSNDLQFDLKSSKESNQLSRIGLLHLPQKYKSIFIIDGQHRLYGYADTKYESNNTIPVVAFHNLKKSEQVKLFMEINENQKPVTKNLRNTLKADLLADSESPIDQYESLCIKIAIQLGEDDNSVLKNRIIIGEISENNNRCITLDTIRVELLNSRMISHYDKNQKLKSRGLLADESFEISFRNIYNYLDLCFKYISFGLQQDWNLGRSGSLTINVGISALIKIFDDILLEVYKSTPDLFLDNSHNEIFENSKKYLDVIIAFYKSLNEKMKGELKTSYGGGGKIKYWRHLQQAINNQFHDFNPTGMEKYFIDNNIENNKKAYEIVLRIETHIKNDIKNKLVSKHGDNWLTLGLPKSVFDSINKLASDKTYERRNENVKIDPWDCMVFINFKEIVIYSSNWTDLFSTSYSKHSPNSKRNKESLVNWMNKLNEIRNDISHSRNISFDNLQFLEEVYSWMFGKVYE